MTEDTTEDATEELLAENRTDDDGAPDDDAPDEAAALAGATDEEEAEEETRAVREYLLKGSLVMLIVLGVVATLQFYVHAQAAIGRLVAAEYQRLYLATFNLIVLLAVGIGIAQVVRRLG